MKSIVPPLLVRGRSKSTLEKQFHVNILKRGFFPKISRHRSTD